MARRDYLKMTGAGAVALGGFGLGSTTAAAAVDEGGPQDPENWSIVFEDYFDAGSLDSSKWDLGFGWGTTENNSPATVTSSHVNVQNNQLSLSASHDDGSNIQTGAVNTRGIAAYGSGHYWEAKIKMPKREGFLPAFWSKPDTEAWPPEIDFVEVMQDGSGWDDTHLSRHTLHWSTSTEPGDSSTHTHSQERYEPGDDVTENYHIYGCWWGDGFIRHYVDGVQVSDFTDDNALTAMSNGGPQYMMLSLHIDRIGETDKSVSWDEEMLVDWVRVWERGSGGDSGTGDGDDDDTDDGTTEGEHYLWLRSADGSEASFEFEASNIRLDDSGNTADYQVASDGSSASGTVSKTSSLPGFWYDGEITAFTYSGALEAFIDDQPVDPDTLGGSSDSDDSSGSSLPNTLAIDGSSYSGSASYSLTVSGAIESANGLDEEDSISGTTATGGVAGGRDEYAFEGELTSLSLDGQADVFVNGQRVNLLRIDRAADSDGMVRYIVETTASVLKADVSGASINGDDSLDGSTIFGKVVGGTDAYWIIDGEIIDVSTFGGDVTTTVNGDVVDYTD
ncbi:glycoside hydrolase family 16 protein [Haloprofundus salilacus]|uniref:glycoside hydrolase family 16 protein n=1 Tax=Haloprofundus salilacus TaxID=2876190 RepID=UPI001CCC74F0|nr:glycoside hydrolase family 16 protein [Haloprofundus salilacus]